MKIVYLAASSDVSGGQRVVFQQSEGLAGRGHAVTLICPEPAPEWFPLRRTHWEMTSPSQSAALAAAEVCVATYWTTVDAAIAHSKGPVFHLCQGYEGDFSFNASIKDRIEAAYSHPTHKLTVSPHVAERLKAIGHRPVTCVGQTFDSNEFQPLDRRAFDRHPPTILIPGIFEAEVKGIREALAAMATLRESGTAFHLERISTWPLSNEEQALFPSDTYHMRLFPSEMLQAYRRADILISPSHPEEGFGLHVLEALSSGLPTLLSDTPGHRHIAGSAAQYFPCGDISLLATHAKRLLEDAPLRADLSARGPGRAARFHTESVVDRLLDVFSNALARRPNNSPL